MFCAFGEPKNVFFCPIQNFRSLKRPGRGARTHPASGNFTQNVPPLLFVQIDPRGMQSASQVTWLDFCMPAKNIYFNTVSVIPSRFQRGVKINIFLPKSPKCPPLPWPLLIKKGGVALALKRPPPSLAAVPLPSCTSALRGATVYNIVKRHCRASARGGVLSVER